ncbi:MULTISPECIES: glutamyl-tRNA reductase [Acidiplasma]|jgi:glutamyl-tRNA reductase|nr:MULTISPECIES: glutamyl-tRNA reductase [Acidiplasma]KJE49444.1 hypothetical protein TZ01_05320 [Acidiplasma sp. MBA-1]KPV46374.1 hypothetical protein SE19_05645 [Acidiplasma aeolicum]KQB36745.1 hypothetical protein AOG54_00250 [Acidiplasma aeolicum]WMT54584.1 MAG: glutamyl-tRNA reductase [Acidiplasma sp.]
MSLIDLVSWNYKDTPEEFNKQVRNGYEYFEDLMIKNSIDNFVILITCNRIEIYFENKLQKEIPADGAIKLSYPESVFHLFNVSSGLESMVVGENDILRQIKDAADLSRKRMHMSKILDFTFQKALSIGKLVRTQTNIAHGKTSMAAIATDIIENKYNSYHNLCIIGTGKMAESLLNYLKGNNGIKITVAGRNIEHAKDLAIRYGCYYSDLSDINGIVNKNDIIITATSSKKYIIDSGILAGINDKRILIDLSNPPNIEKIGRKNIEIYSFEDIGKISEETRKQRDIEIRKARSIIEDEFKLYEYKINQIRSDDIIAIFYKFAEKVKEDEVNELTKKVDLNEVQLKYINLMMNSFTNKILSPYTNSVKTFIKNNERYSYILNEYEKMLNERLGSNLKKLLEEN